MRARSWARRFSLAPGSASTCHISRSNWLIGVVPWAAMFSIVIIGIGILYRYGPNVKTPRTRIFTWGALFAALAWAAASVAFSGYLARFDSYNRIYGSIGAVVALLMWFYLAGFSVMMGALINVELDRHKRLVQARKARALARERRPAGAPGGPGRGCPATLIRVWLDTSRGSRGSQHPE